MLSSNTYSRSSPSGVILVPQRHQVWQSIFNVLHEPRRLFERYPTEYRRSEKSKRKQLKNSLEPPRLEKRKRALSMSDQTKSWRSHDEPKALSQHQSLIFRLPAEIRIAIYKHYFGTKHIYFLLTDYELCAFRDHVPSTRLRPRRSSAAQRARLDLLPMLQTCRRIYSEAIDLMYDTPTFTFHDPHSFLALSTTLVPHRFATIRSLHLDFHAAWTSLRLNLADPPGFTTRSYTYDSRSSRSYVPSDWDDWSVLIDGRLDYHLISRSKLHFMNQLPHPTVNDNKTYWGAACQMVAKMHGLRNLIIDVSTVRCRPSQSADAVAESLFGPLKSIQELHLESFNGRIATSASPSPFMSWIPPQLQPPSVPLGAPPLYWGPVQPPIPPAPPLTVTTTARQGQEWRGWLKDGIIVWTHEPAGS